MLMSLVLGGVGILTPFNNIFFKFATNNSHDELRDLVPNSGIKIFFMFFILFTVH